MSSDIEGLKLAQAIWTNNESMLSELLEQGTDPDTITPTGIPVLSMACQRGNPNIIRLLLKNGANPNIRHQDTIPLLFLVTDGAWSTFLEYRWECVEELLKAGALVDTIVNANNESSLMCFAWEAGHGEQLVKKCLELRITPNLPSLEVRLISAVKKRQLRLAQSLLGLGVNTNFRANTDDCGATPLMIAAKNGDYEMTKLLLENGANIKMKTEKHRRLLLNNPTRSHYFTLESTALEFAVIRGMYRVIELLLSYGEPYSGRPSEYRLVKIVKQMERHDLAQLLIRYGYDFSTPINNGVIIHELPYHLPS
jgi:ankyrin repeat protein